MKAFYLEPDEEITSVIDRLKTIDEREVAIVIPKRAGLLQSIINLKLIKQQGERQNKELSIVTTDKTGRNLASAVGLTVYQKLPKGGEVAPAVPATPPVEIPIEIRKRRPEPETKKPDIADIGYKSGMEPKVSTRAVQQEPAVAQEPAEPVSDKPAAPIEQSDSPAKEPKKGFFKRKRSSEPKPPVEEKPPVEPKPSHPAPQESLDPRPERSKGRSGFNLPLLRLPKMPRLGKRFGAAGIIGLLIVLLAGGGTAAAIMLPKAEITVTPKTAPLTAEIPLTFSTRATTTDTAGNVIPAKVVEVIKQSSKQVPATGPQSEGGNRATGTITVTNNLQRNQSLVAQTRFQAPDGSIYRISSRLVIPAGGQANATVTAAAAGESGNLPAGTALTVPGLGGGAGVTAAVAEAFSGGSSGAGTVVSRDDVERAKNELATQAAKEGIDEAKGKVAVGFKIDERVMVPTVINVTPEPAIGTTTPTFTVSGQVRITYFTYEDAEAQRVISEDLQPKVPPGADLINEATRQEFVASQTSSDTLGGVVKITTLTAPEISRDQIKSDVHGQTPAEAESTLRATGKLDNVLVKLSPFWVRTVPDSADRVFVRYDTTGITPSAAPSPATPSPSPSLDPSATPLPSLPPSL